MLGIFKNCAEINFYLGSKLGFEAKINYKSEEVMMRLVARFVKMMDGLWLYLCFMIFINDIYKLVH